MKVKDDLKSISNKMKTDQGCSAECPPGSDPLSLLHLWFFLSTLLTCYLFCALLLVVQLVAVSFPTIRW